MEPPPAKTGLFVGLNKGHVVTKRKLQPRPSTYKGVSINAAIDRSILLFLLSRWSFRVPCHSCVLYCVIVSCRRSLPYLLLVG